MTRNRLGGWVGGVVYNWSVWISRENMNNDTKTDCTCMGRRNDTLVYGSGIYRLLYHTIANLNDVRS